MLDCSRHGECFARPGGSISKYTSIVASNDWWNELGACSLVHIWGSDRLAEDPIEEVALLTTPMKHIRLFIIAFILNVHFVKYYNQLILGLYDCEIFVQMFLLRKRSESDRDDHIWVMMIFLQELSRDLVLLTDAFFYDLFFLVFLDNRRWCVGSDSTRWQRWLLKSPIIVHS